MNNEKTNVIKVVGIGSCGGNILEHIINSQIDGVEFIAINTDQQVLENFSSAATKILISNDIKRGFAAGFDSFDDSIEHCESVQKSIKEIKATIEEAEMVILIAGMGGMTGTNISLLFAQVAKSLGILTFGIVTLPFAAEGLQRMTTGENGAAQLKKLVNSLVVMPNDQICSSVENDTFELYRTGDVIITGVLNGILDFLTELSDVDTNCSGIN